MRSRAVSLPRAVLGVDARLPAAHAGDLAAALEFLENVFHGRLPRHGRSRLATPFGV